MCIVEEQALERQDAWMAAASGCDVPDLETFAAGLKRERAELMAVLVLAVKHWPGGGRTSRPSS